MSNSIPSAPFRVMIGSSKKMNNVMKCEECKEYCESFVHLGKHWCGNALETKLYIVEADTQCPLPDTTDLKK